MNEEEALQRRQYSCPICEAEPGDNCRYVFVFPGYKPNTPFAHSDRGGNP